MIITNVKLNNLISKLTFFKLSLAKPHMSSTEIFEYVNKMNSYSNISIAYQILFTIPITLASNERSFLIEIIEEPFEVYNLSRTIVSFGHLTY
jgi:hypothetical protein